MLLKIWLFLPATTCKGSPKLMWQSHPFSQEFQRQNEQSVSVRVWEQMLKQHATTWRVLGACLAFWRIQGSLATCFRLSTERVDITNALVMGSSSSWKWHHNEVHLLYLMVPCHQVNEDPVVTGGVDCRVQSHVSDAVSLWQWWW